MKGLVIIPVHRDDEVNPFFLKPLAGRSALGRTLDFSRSLSELRDLSIRIAVTTNDPVIAKACADEPDVYVHARTEGKMNEALKEALFDCEDRFDCRFDLVFVLEPPQPFRPKTLAVEAYELLANSPRLESAVCAKQLHGRIWAGDKELQPLPAFLAKDFYDNSAPFVELLGLLLVSRRHVIAGGDRVGGHVGLVVVDRKWHFVDINSAESFKIAEHLEPLYRSDWGNR